jgi:hypothetical protein
VSGGGGGGQFALALMESCPKSLLVKSEVTRNATYLPPALPLTKSPSFALPQSVLFRSCTAFVAAQRSEREKERAIVADCFSAFALRDLFRDRGISGPAVRMQEQVLAFAICFKSRLV